MNSFRKSILNPLKFGVFKLSRLPLTFIAGLRVKQITDERATIQIKHNHWTKNPFKSIYFGAQAMAAEISTGILVMDKIQQHTPKKISMLVLSMEADFKKKATGKVLFTCDDGAKLALAMDKILSTNQGETVKMKSVGIDESGDIVSIFIFTWTLKEKK